jgi:cell division protease FtsH
MHRIERVSAVARRLEAAVSSTKPGRGQQPFNTWYIVLAVVGALLAHNAPNTAARIEVVPYSQFEQLVTEGKVAQVTVGPETIRGTLTEPLESGRTAFLTHRVDPQLAERLAAKGVLVTGAPEGSSWGALLWLLGIAAFCIFWIFLSRAAMGGQGLGGLMSAGKSRARVYAETDIKVTFKEVAGVDEAKFELQEVVAFLRDPKSFGRLGARTPKGILLVGPPGTGKTLLARAVAGEAGVPFFSISGSEFVEMFVGVGAARVRDLFEQARAAAPSIIFIDELDALGRARSAMNLPGGHDEKEQTLNQLLAELDGFDASVGVILLAATNRPEILDPALLRAGRFDRQVLVDRPDAKGRLDILKVHVKGITLDPACDLGNVATMTTGFTGADIANLVNEAAIIATRRRGASVGYDDFTAAVERVVAGIEKKSRVLSAPERRRVACHEMGHALVAASLPGVDPVLKVSIIPRGIGALGYTIQRPTEDRFLLGDRELRNRIAVLMGGRAAEVLVFDGEVSTGAADDLQRATEVALEMVTRFGMAPELGQRTYARPPQSFLGLGVERERSAQATEREIDLAVRHLVEEGFERAMAILADRRSDLDQGAALLIERESITADDLPALKARPVDGGKLPRPASKRLTLSLPGVVPEAGARPIARKPAQRA